MNSVQYVEININKIGANLDILLNIQKNSVIVNNIEKNITHDKIDELFRIIRLWKNEYTNSNILDAEKFSVKIISNNYKDIIIGNGSFPENYIEFKKWVGDICE